MFTRSLARTLFASGSLLAALLAPRGAGATVDALLQTNIAAAHEQVDTYCYLKAPVSAALGIPAMALIEGSLAPSYALRFATPLPPGVTAPWVIEIGGRKYVNINALARGAAPVFTYIQDSFTSSGALELKGELDMTAVAAQQGSTIAGRQATIDRAKLALLVIAKDLKDANAGSGGLYRLFLTFKGLPSQTGLSGARLYAKTSVPYSGGSPLLASYEKELIDAAVCGSGSALYGSKADEVLQSDEPAAAGCALGPAQSGGLTFALLALLGLFALRRRG